MPARSWLTLPEATALGECKLATEVTGETSIRSREGIHPPSGTSL
jgi:hypothetical protein